MTKVVLICGGRSYGRIPIGTPPDQMAAARLKADREVFMLREALDQAHRKHRFTKVIDGAAPGADALAHQWAIDRRIPTLRYRANWKLLGRAAGPIRNAQMLREGRPDLVIAFPGGSGTENMVTLAKQAGIEVINLG